MMCLIKKILLLIFIIIVCADIDLFAVNGNPVFVENKGQWPSEVLFRAEFPGYHAWITKKGLVLNLFRFEEFQNESNPPLRKKNSLRVSGDAVYFFNDGCNTSGLTPQGIGKKSAVYNFFISGNRITDVPTYDEVWIRNVYPGIDQRWYSDGGNLRFDFLVHRRADYNNIQILTDEFTQVKIKDHAAELQTRFGPMRLMELHCFQDGKELKSHLKTENGKIKFEIENYDKNKDLVIDPVLFATYLGGSSSDITPIVRCDAGNDIIVACNTLSMDFPTIPGSYDFTANGNNDVCVSKLSSNGSNLIFSTYVGGSGYDYVTDLELSSSGEIFICGETESADWPAIPGSYDTGFNGGNSDAFVAKFNSSCNQLLSSGFLGGNNSETINKLMINENLSCVYITGLTSSGDFPTISSAYDVTYNGLTDIFVSKMDLQLSNLLSSTFIGGTYDEVSLTILSDSNNDIYVGGYIFNYPSGAPSFPLLNGIYSNVVFPPSSFYYTNNRAGFILKINQQLSALLFSTLTSSVANNYEVKDLLINENNSSLYAYVVNSSSNNKIEILKLNLYGTSISKKITINNINHFNSVNSNNHLFNKNNKIYIGTSSVSNVLNNGFSDMYLLEYDTLLNLIQMGNFGTNSQDILNSFCLDNANNIIIGGYTNSSLFLTTPSSYDPSFNGIYDLIILKTDSCFTAVTHSVNAPNGMCNGNLIQYTIFPSNLNYTIYTPAMSVFLANTFTVNSSMNGIFTVQATNLKGCNINYTFNVYVHPQASPVPTIVQTPDTICKAGYATLTALPSGMNYTWNVGSNFSYLPQLTYSFSSTAIVNLTIKDPTTGCLGIKNYWVNISPNKDIYGINVNNQYLCSITYSQLIQSIQWLDCNNAMQPIPGATLSTFTVTQNGSYAAAWAYGSCSGTTACQTFSTIGLNELSSSANTWAVFPNPASDGRFFIFTAQDISINITDLSGKILYHNLFIPKGNHELKLNLPPGVYFIQEKKSRLVRKWVTQ